MTPSSTHCSKGARTPDDLQGGAEAPHLVPWKPGCELAPYVDTNPAAVQLCQDILKGTVAEFPSISVSET